MDIRPFAPTDRDACLAVFDSNADVLHAPHRAEFASFLANLEGTYLVMEHDDSVVGCGGYSLEPEHASATIRWPMIRRDSQKLGLGRFLLLYCIREVSKLDSAQLVFLAAPSNTAPFFEKQGFKPAGLVRDGFAPGIDRVDLRMKLAVCP